MRKLHELFTNEIFSETGIGNFSKFIEMNHIFNNDRIRCKLIDL